MADFHVLQYERDDGVKRSKPNWPPGPVGHRFFVLKNDSSKWPSSTFKDLRILGEYASCFERFFLGKELTLEAHLDNLSTMSHLLFALYR
jgi:hypothetical protein